MSQTKWKYEVPEKQLTLTVKVLIFFVVSRMSNKCTFVLVKYDLIDSWKHGNAILTTPFAKHFCEGAERRDSNERPQFTYDIFHTRTSAGISAGWLAHGVERLTAVRYFAGLIPGAGSILRVFNSLQASSPRRFGAFFTPRRKSAPESCSQARS